MQLPAILLGVLLNGAILTSAKQPSNAILLSSVKSLTLYDGRKTSHRRVSAIPQLKCVGGNARGLHTVDVMRCQNSGSDYDKEDIQWTCQASLPPEFKLGSTEVICEGYDSPDDKRILKGSCGVEYRLILTKSGEEVYGDRRSYFGSNGGSGDSSPVFTFLFWAAFIGVLAWIVYRAFVPADGAPRQRGLGGNGWFGGGGGGGGGGWRRDDDPPPPYTPRAPKSTRSNPSTRSSWFGGNNYGLGQQPEQGWRPGFWTGAATGAAAGYMAGARGQTSQRDRYQDEQRRSTGWYGSGAAGSSRSPGGGSSSSTYESSGFGGTSRR